MVGSISEGEYMRYKNKIEYERSKKEKWPAD